MYTVLYTIENQSKSQITIILQKYTKKVAEIREFQPL